MVGEHAWWHWAPPPAACCHRASCFTAFTDCHGTHGQAFHQILVPFRKKKAVHKTTSTDDKRLQNTLKRLGVNTIPGIEEVNIFKSDSEVVHFVNPKGGLPSTSSLSTGGDAY